MLGSHPICTLEIRLPYRPNFFQASFISAHERHILLTFLKICSDRRNSVSFLTQCIILFFDPMQFYSLLLTLRFLTRNCKGRKSTQPICAVDRCWALPSPLFSLSRNLVDILCMHTTYQKVHSVPWPRFVPMSPYKRKIFSHLLRSFLSSVETRDRIKFALLSSSQMASASSLTILHHVPEMVLGDKI